MLKNYKFRFDIWALLLFLLIMLPNLIWSVIPAPDDVLRKESVTATIDLITSACQVLMIASLTFLNNTESPKFGLTPLVIGAGVCCLIYYLCWWAYYQGIVGPLIIMGLTLPPSLAFVMYAIDRKNLIAAILALCFTAGHSVYAIMNFIL